MFSAGRKLKTDFTNNNLGGGTYFNNNDGNGGKSITNNNGPITPASPTPSGAHLLACLVEPCTFSCHLARGSHDGALASLSLCWNLR